MTLTEFLKLNATCYISPEIMEVRIWLTLIEMRQARICGEQDFKCEGERNEHLLHYKQEFCMVFERRESKYCRVLMKHRRKVKGEQVITLQMAQQLKNKNINAVPGQLFCCQCKDKFLLETD